MISVIRPWQVEGQQSDDVMYFKKRNASSSRYRKLLTNKHSNAQCNRQEQPESVVSDEIVRRK